MKNTRLQFERPLLMPPRKEGGLWELAKDWQFVYRGEMYELPKGLLTDGASIPRFLWRLCGSPLDIPRLYAALVHDFIYAGGDQDATRLDADCLYRDIQIELGISPFKAWVEFIALRFFGGGHFYKTQERKMK